MNADPPPLDYASPARPVFSWLTPVSFALLGVWLMAVGNLMSGGGTFFDRLWPLSFLWPIMGIATAAVARKTARPRWPASVMITLHLLALAATTVIIVVLASIGPLGPPD